MDQQWKEHLNSLEQLRQSIGLRAYGQKDPLNEYKRESFELFDSMLQNVRTIITSILSHLEISNTSIEKSDKNTNNKYSESDWGKVPRNAKCPCGSGRKYKFCHGRLS